MRQTDRYYKFDWLTIFLFFILVIFGWVNIISASHSGEALEFTNFSHFYSKQLVFIGLSIVLIVLVLSIESKFYERFSSIIYFIALISLAGLFVFGKNINLLFFYFNHRKNSINLFTLMYTATPLLYA